MRNCAVCGKVYTNRGTKCRGCVSREWKLKNPAKWKVLQRQQNARFRAKHRKPDVKKPCHLCKKMFTTSRQTPYQKFCSYSCQVLQFKINNREKVAAWKRQNREKRQEFYTQYNHEYKDKMRFSGNRKLVLDRDSNTCQDCGDKGPKLNVHHIDKSGQSPSPNNNVDNLVTLCAACHKRRHLSSTPNKD